MGVGRVEGRVARMRVMVWMGRDGTGGPLCGRLQEKFRPGFARAWKWMRRTTWNGHGAWLAVMGLRSCARRVSE